MEIQLPQRELDKLARMAEANPEHAERMKPLVERRYQNLMEKQQRQSVAPQVSTPSSKSEELGNGSVKPTKTRRARKKKSEDPT